MGGEIIRAHQVESADLFFQSGNEREIFIGRALQCHAAISRRAGTPGH
jgi:hypothetical protein